MCQVHLKSPPARCAGAVVMELLPYNWEWNGISRTYANLTASRGDIHHMAWRAKHPRCGSHSSSVWHESLLHCAAWRAW